jgi:hypothetical protein
MPITDIYRQTLDLPINIGRKFADIGKSARLLVSSLKRKRRSFWVIDYVSRDIAPRLGVVLM